MMLLVDSLGTRIGSKNHIFSYLIYATTYSVKSIHLEFLPLILPLRLSQTGCLK